MLGFLSKLFGDKAAKDIKEIQPFVDKTLKAFEALSSISNDELRAKTEAFKNQIQEYIKSELLQVEELKAKAESESDVEQKELIFEEIDRIEDGTNKKIEEVLLEIMPEAFAVVKETARRFAANDTIEVSASEMDRDLAPNKGFIDIQGDKAFWKTTWQAGGNEIKWDMTHYDVQLIGGVTLHKGKIAEMQTGEGKTLVATLPVYLNALAGRGVHVVTVNNYLARRDMEWMGPLYQFHGLSVDCIDLHQPNSQKRRDAYNADITFGTNNEFGFDYLRDNMSQEVEGLVQRKHHYAIVDEVDSVLIDDARTPLIISGPVPGGDKHQFNELKPAIEKLVSYQKKATTQFLTEAKKLLKGIDSGEASKDNLTEGGVSLLRAFRGLPRNKALIKFLSEPGVKAHLQKTENYYLQDQQKQMPEVDKELYFTIDEKNNSIDLTEKGIELISSDNDPNFYIMPDLGSALFELDELGLEGQERAKRKEEITNEYRVKSERIHSMNQLLKAYTLFEKDTEYVVMNNKVMIVDEQTGRIMDGRRYSDGLHQAIEAKESVKVEAATQTYATVTLQNYFRMYHKLSGMTGTAETEAGEFWDIYELDVVVIPTNRPIQRKDKQDKVYKTKREKYTAVIDEIVRVREENRPTLVGTTSVEISELLGKMLKLKGIPHNVLNAKQHEKEADIVAQAGNAGMVTIATNMAGRGTDIKLSEEVKAAGGLVIIGTERHDSRRVDRQLRGRSGRQGDPGESQFFVSLEDNLMRLFGSERIAKMMDRMGLEEGEVIQHGMITKSIERAQKKVEENNFGVRKRLLEYDDVMNSQREVIYKKRRNALYGDRLAVDVSEMYFNVCEVVAEKGKSENDFEEFKYHLLKTFSLEPRFSKEEFLKMNVEQIAHNIFEDVDRLYKEKRKSIADQAFPVIKNVYENQGEQYKNIAVPFTNGQKAIQVAVDLEKAYKSQGEEIALSLEKIITLAVIDDMWKEHLREMDDLRQSVQLAVHEQKDPLLIYKFESFELFQKMIREVSTDVIDFLTRAMIPVEQSSREAQIQATSAPLQRKSTPKLQESHAEAGQVSGGETAVAEPQTQQKPKTQPVRVEEKIGRNDPCPCGSGKKYKNCHGKDA